MNRFTSAEVPLSVYLLIASKDLSSIASLWRREGEREGGREKGREGEMEDGGRKGGRE